MPRAVREVDANDAELQRVSGIEISIERVKRIETEVEKLLDHHIRRGRRDEADVGCSLVREPVIGKDRDRESIEPSRTRRIIIYYTVAHG